VGTPYLLGIDLGTTTCRAAVFDPQGRQAGVSSLETAARYPRPTWAEVDPRVWWEGTARVLRQALDAAGVEAQAIAGVGLTGLMHAPVLVDAAGEAVTPAMLWMDQRCAPQSARLERSGSSGRFGTSLSAAKLRWLADEQPQALARAAHLLLPKDFLRLRLTGAVATDPSDAGGTGLYRRQEGAWDWEAVDVCGVPRRLLPPVRPAWSLAGSVTPEAARATGLAPGTPVAVGGADTYCTRLGIGGLAPGEACIYVGTAAWVAVTTAPPGGPLGGPPGSSPPGGEVVRGFGSTATTGAALRWARDLIAPPGDTGGPGGPGGPDGVPRGDRQGSVSATYDAIVGAAAGVPPGAEGLFFLPHLMGERGPRPDPLARGALVGLTLLHGRGHVVRAVLEGTAFQIRRLLEERLSEGRGGALRGAVVCGGGARSVLWVRLLADITALPLRVPAVVEAGVLGAAILGGVAAGVHTLEEGRAKMVGPARPVVPDPLAAARYGPLFERYRDLDDLLTPWFHRQEAQDPQDPQDAPERHDQR
jgi:xylulokinase